MLTRMPWICSIVLASTMGACDGSSTTSDEASSVIWGNPVSELGYFVVDYEKGTRDGIYVRSVNSEGTQCLDGVVRSSCRMDEVSFASAGLPREEALDFENELLAGYGVVEGWMELAPPRRGEEGVTHVINVLHAWRSTTLAHADDIRMYHVALNGIVCMRAPCPSMTAIAVNTEHSLLIDTLDLAVAGADKDTTTTAYEALAEGGVLVAGSIQEGTVVDTAMDEVKEAAMLPPSEGRMLNAKVFYLQLEGREASPTNPR